MRDKTRLAFALGVLALLAPGAAEAQFCQGPNGPYYCGDPNSCDACAPNRLACNHPCDQNGVPSTCGAALGNPPNDLDRDGVPNASDNCICQANSNQADCDRDGQGNACDATDNSWTRVVAGAGTCYIDIDDHILYETAEFYRRDVYRSSCTGTTCVKKVLFDSFNCTADISMDCCLRKAKRPSDCYLAWGFDSCGQPACRF